MVYVPWIISGLALVVSFLMYLHTLDKDNNIESKETDSKIDSLTESMTEANIMLKLVNGTVTDIRSELKSMDKRINEVDKELAVVKRDIKTAFTKIDEINDKMR